LMWVRRLQVTAKAMRIDGPSATIAITLAGIHQFRLVNRQIATARPSAGDSAQRARAGTAAGRYVATGAPNTVTSVISRATMSRIWISVSAIAARESR
jgi:hypothetical protein